MYMINYTYTPLYSRLSIVLYARINYYLIFFLYLVWVIILLICPNICFRRNYHGFCGKMYIHGLSIKMIFFKSLFTILTEQNFASIKYIFNRHARKFWKKNIRFVESVNLSHQKCTIPASWSKLKPSTFSSVRTDECSFLNLTKCAMEEIDQLFVDHGNSVNIGWL